MSEEVRCIPAFFVTVLDFEVISAGGRMRMEGPQVVRSLPRPCGFSDFYPAAAPAYLSPEAASTMWSKKLLPASQSVTMFVNRIEFVSIPFPDRFPPPSLRATTTFLFDLSTGLLSGGTPDTRR